MIEKKQKAILTYQEYIQEYPAWNKDTFRKKVELEGFPAVKDGKSWVISRLEANRWWAKKGLKVS